MAQLIGGSASAERLVLLKFATCTVQIALRNLSPQAFIEQLMKKENPIVNLVENQNNCGSITVSEINEEYVSQLS